MRLNLPKSFQKLALFSTMTPNSSTTTSALATPSNVAMGTTSALERARQLQLPTREEMLRRDGKVYDFWNHNEDTLERAWEEWNQHDQKALDLPKIDSSIINPKLRQAVEAAWKNPTPENEAAIKELWEEVAPGVYAIQFFDLEELHKLRQWFDTTAEAGIPTRPPYGIVLNRKGMMIDPRSVGYLAAPDFQTFYKLLVDEYVRPLGRLFFPEHIRETDDSESFAFSIQYQGEAGGDKSIRHHTDASTVTFNLNLDSTKTWTGSSLVFIDRERGNHEVTWSPGYAVMHLGKSMHAAYPIQSGTRSNWVIWTFAEGGGGGYGRMNPLASDGGCYPEEYQMSAEERWTKPAPVEGKPWMNRWSPF